MSKTTKTVRGGAGVWPPPDKGPRKSIFDEEMLEGIQRYVTRATKIIKLTKTVMVPHKDPRKLIFDEDMLKESKSM